MNKLLILFQIASSIIFTSGRATNIGHNLLLVNDRGESSNINDLVMPKKQAPRNDGYVNQQYTIFEVNMSSPLPSNTYNGFTDNFLYKITDFPSPTKDIFYTLSITKGTFSNSIIRIDSISYIQVIQTMQGSTGSYTDEIYLSLYNVYRINPLIDITFEDFNFNATSIIRVNTEILYDHTDSTDNLTYYGVGLNDLDSLFNAFDVIGSPYTFSQWENNDSITIENNIQSIIDTGTTSIMTINWNDDEDVYINTNIDGGLWQEFQGRNNNPIYFIQKFPYIVLDYGFFGSYGEENLLMLVNNSAKLEIPTHYTYYVVILEVFDLGQLFLDIITAPFYIFQQAFNFTLFPGTPYAINISNILVGIIVIVIIVMIIKIAIKLMK